MPDRTMLMTIGYVMLALAIINNVDALKPVANIVNGKNGIFG